MKRQTKRRFEGPNMRSDSPHTHAIRRYIYIYIYIYICVSLRGKRATVHEPWRKRRVFIPVRGKRAKRGHNGPRGAR